MMNHKIVMKFDCFTLHKLEISRIIRKCIGATLQMEGVNAPCEINVLITNDQGIREINRGTNIVNKVDTLIEFENWLVAHREEYPEMDDKTIILINRLHSDFMGIKFKQS